MKEMLNYDVVISNQAEFESLIASPNWLGATTVCFVGDGGNLKFTKKDGDRGILIPDKVKKIRGLGNATIEISSVYRNDFNHGLHYKYLNNDKDCSIIDISVIMKNTYHCNAFTNCYQLINCQASVETIPGGNAKGFYGCASLINCTSTTTGDRSVGFLSCEGLVGCVGSATGTSFKSAFEDCVNLVRCNGSVSRDSVFGNPFHQCVNLTDCNGNSGTGDGATFTECMRLVKCKGQLLSENEKNLSAFDSCTVLIDCEEYC